MPLKAAVRSMLRRRGYDIVSYRPVSSLASHLSILFERLDINCVLDVGAHRGEYGTFLREIGFKGRIVSFEPVSANFDALRTRAFPDTNWDCFPFALGQENGSREILVPMGTVLSSFRQPSAFGVTEYGEGLAESRRETVQVRRLEDIYSEATHWVGWPRAFLKMDTQGWDLQVMDGAQGILSLISGLQSEVAFKPLYDGSPLYAEAIRCLEGYGFALSALFPVAHDRDLEMIEADAVMVRRQSVHQSDGVRIMGGPRRSVTSTGPREST